VPVIKREAREQRKAFREHLAHLAVHGVLHAQGHEHDRAVDARKMEAREVEILAELGIDDPYRAGGGTGN
jgi:probable rRNA maturation factor